MIKRIKNEKFKQTLGNYEIVTDTALSDYEEEFINVANRVGSLAYTINDMNRFISNAIDNNHEYISDDEWVALTRKLHKIEYLLNDCKDRYSSIYDDINVE